MVLSRELDGAKDYPLVIHPVGYEWERQVRAHYTRADGTLNINGCYFEMFGFTVNSIDFESESNDSDSDSSGNDRDCIIISSSEFSYKHPNNRSLIVPDSVAMISTSMEISSRFTTTNSSPPLDRLSRDTFVRFRCGEGFPELMFDVSGNRLFRFYWSSSPLLIKGTRTSTLNEYERMASDFESGNSVATISTSMEISSRFTTDEFVSTFRLVVHVSGEGGENRVRIDPVAMGEDTFVRFRCGEGFPELIFDVSGNRLFPFYWSSSLRLIKGTRTSTLNEYERMAVSSLSRAALILKTRAQKAEAERVSASADATAQLVVEEGGVKNTKRKNPEESGRIPVEIPKKRKSTVVDDEEIEIEDEPLKRASSHCCPSNPEVRKGKRSNLSANLWTKDFDSFDVVDDGFQKYARTSYLSDLTFEDLRQAAMDHHIQGVILTYYLSNRQELDSIDFRNKMESADTSLSALEKEFAAAKSKFEEDLAVVKAEQEGDEVVALKGKVKTLEGELTEEKAKAKTQQEEASLNVEALTTRIEKLAIDGVSQFDDGFRFALDQVKVAFPDVDAVKLGELDSVNQIVDGKIVPYVPPTSD
ncbi:hypothetical protein TSUD_279770 [Trifolium subterraneum]|uniref:Uncharacterized protein n=1 Tax=Trifolium subterraneum TaxID=3900 RepID=A0A2Z6NNV4_TRISU|nr:hypothetical protein TSUD_279770 [Trifolium subterraneum]